MVAFIRALNLYYITFGILLASLLFNRNFGRRKLWLLRLLGFFVLMLGVSVLMSYAKNALTGLITQAQGTLTFFIFIYLITVVTHCIIFALGVLAVYASYRVSVSEAMFIGSASYALQSLTLCLFSVIMKACGFKYQLNIQDFVANPLNFLILIALFAAVYSAAYFAFVRKFTREKDFITRIWVFLFIVSFANIILASVSVPPDDEQSANRLYMILIFSRIMLCGGGFFTQFVLSHYYDLQVRQTELNRIIDLQKSQFEIASENIDKVNVNAHDLRKQLGLILQSVGTDGEGGVERRVKEIEKELSIVDAVFQTGNKALDVTLTEKAGACFDKGIKFSAMADGACLGALDDFDVYMLFGNLLDNAIEAAERVPDSENRIISLSLNNNFGCRHIHIENTYEVEPRFVNGVPQTVKDDKRKHGFGVRSIKNIVRKYGGTVSMNVARGMFCVDITMAD